jgi:hypothetical protein
MNGYWPIIIALSILVYVMLMQNFQRIVQPLRLEMAEKGEWLLSRDSLDTEARARVSYMLGSAFNSRLISLFRILVMPFLAILIILRPKTLDDMTYHLNIQDKVEKEYFNAVFRLHTRITLVNHPILFSIFIAEMSIAIPLFDLSSAIKKGVVSATIISRAWKAREFRFLAWERPLNVIMAFADKKMYQYLRLA